MGLHLSREDDCAKFTYACMIPQNLCLSIGVEECTTTADMKDKVLSFVEVIEESHRGKWQHDTLLLYSIESQ